MGKEGTKVTVTILRDGVKKDYELTRSVIEQKYVRYSMLDNNIGYVYLAQFTVSSIEQFENAVSDLKKMVPKVLFLTSGIIRAVF